MNPKLAGSVGGREVENWKNKRVSRVRAWAIIGRVPVGTKRMDCYGCVSVSGKRCSRQARIAGDHWNWSLRRRESR